MGKRRRSKNRWQMLQERRGFFSDGVQRGRAGQRRGRNSEARVWTCIETIGTDAWPVWALNARPATTEEDHRGIDFVVQTDQGEVYLQVKSSHGGAEDFLKNHVAARELPIGVVVVLESSTADRLRRQVLYKLTVLRGNLMGWSTLDHRHRRLVASIDTALKTAINCYGPINKEGTQVVAQDLAVRLKTWLERETGMIDP